MLRVKIKNSIQSDRILFLTNFKTLKFIVFMGRSNGIIELS